MTRTALPTALTLLACAVSALSLELPQQPIRAYHLANGLGVVMAADHLAPVVDVQVWYHVGSRDEKPGMTGLAHLFEHLMFDGTKNLRPEEFSNYVIRCGGVDNAYTTEDATVFWETLPSVDLPVALWLEADRMRNLTINPATFDNERRVVEEEERDRFGNQPYGNVMQTLYESAFTVSPYRHRPIGSLQDLEHATLADVQSFYNAYYRPANATLVLAGNFDESAAAKWIDQYFAGLENPGSLPPPRAYPKEPPQTSERRIDLHQPVALPAFVEGYHIPADGTPDAYPLELAAKILADGESSWLYRHLVYRKQIAMQVDSEGNFSELPNLFFIFAVMNPGHTPAEGEREVSRALDRLKRGAISREDLERAKNEVLRDYVLSREDAKGRADVLGYDDIVLNDPNLYNTEIERFLGVTAADIERVALKYLLEQNMTLVEVYPSGKQAAGAP